MPDAEWPGASGEPSDNLAELLEAPDLSPLNLSLASTNPPARAAPKRHKRTQKKPAAPHIDPELPTALQQLRIADQLIAHAEAEPTPPSKPPQAFKPGFLTQHNETAAADKQPVSSQQPVRSSTAIAAAQDPSAGHAKPSLAARHAALRPWHTEQASESADPAQHDPTELDLLTSATLDEQAETYGEHASSTAAPAEVRAIAELLQASSADLGVDPLPSSSEPVEASYAALLATPLPDLHTAPEPLLEPDTSTSGPEPAGPGLSAAHPSTDTLSDQHTANKPSQEASDTEPADLPPPAQPGSGAPPEVRAAAEVLRALTAGADSSAARPTLEQEEAASAATFAALQPVCRGLMQARVEVRAAVELLARLQQLLGSCSPEGLQACLTYLLMPLMYLVDSAAAARSGNWVSPSC